MLIVRYIGQRGAPYKGCTNPSVLTVGQLYEVAIKLCDGGFVLYELQGIKGTFPQGWFSIVGESYGDAFETQVWRRCRVGYSNQWIRIA